jgi:ribosomal protein L37AE/L43A
MARSKYVPAWECPACGNTLGEGVYTSPTCQNPAHPMSVRRTGPVAMTRIQHDSEGTAAPA